MERGSTLVADSDGAALGLHTNKQGRTRILECVHQLSGEGCTVTHFAIAHRLGIDETMASRQCDELIADGALSAHDGFLSVS